jgi:hypothetical protein
MLQRVSVITHRISRKFTISLRLCKKTSKNMVSSRALGISKGKTISNYKPGQDLRVPGG